MPQPHTIMVRSADPRRASPGVATIARSAAVITKDFISAKDLCTYSIIILRQEKIVRDHRADGGLVR
jgi:hypothetical protein